MTLMKRMTRFKQTALFLTLIYLFLSSLMMARIGRHALEHEHHTHHAAQHASLACDWMCGASTFIQTDNHRPSPASTLSPENLPINVEQISSRLFRSSNPIRPPPSL